MHAARYGATNHAHWRQDLSRDLVYAATSAADTCHGCEMSEAHGEEGAAYHIQWCMLHASALASEALAPLRVSSARLGAQDSYPRCTHRLTVPVMVVGHAMRDCEAGAE